MLNFLIARFSASQSCKRRTHLGFLHRSASHIFNSLSSVAKSSEPNQPKQRQEANESFTVSYLMNSLGLSPNVAIEVSQKVDIKYPDKPDLVLNLLRSYRFSDTQIRKLVIKYPPVLVSNPENSLLPKLRFFQSIGFSRSELRKLFISNCRLLTWSLKKRITPGYEALKSMLDANKTVDDADKTVDIIRKLKGWNFLHYDVSDVVTNIKLLREHGAPQSSVNLLLKSFTSAAFISHTKFVEHVKFAEEIGFEPSQATFIQAIYVLSMIKKSSWESKLKVYERCGWSRDDTLLLFCKFPYCMFLSEDKITKAVKFLMDEMGLALEDIYKCPVCLGYSLKKRIIPRCSVVKILKMKGLIKNSKALSTILVVSEKKFRQNFLVRFRESVPELLNIYEGQLRSSPVVQS